MKMENSATFEWTTNELGNEAYKSSVNIKEL